MSTTQSLIGVDVGGSGIKAALVDLEHRHRDRAGSGSRRRNPRPPTRFRPRWPSSSRKLGADGPIGCTLPAVVVGGTVRTAAHIDESWIGTHAAAVFAQRDRAAVHRAERRRRGRDRGSALRCGARPAGRGRDGHGRHRRRHRAPQRRRARRQLRARPPRGERQGRRRVGLRRRPRGRSTSPWKQWAERLDTLPHASSTPCSGPS